MSVITVDFGTRQRGPEPTPTISTPVEWWTHPSFCDRTCYGGHTYTWPSGWSNTFARVHHADTYRQDLVDVDDNNEIQLAAGVAAAESPDDGYEPVAVRLEINDTSASVSADTAEEYAHAILAAVALARQALPLITRSPLHGGGRASNLPDAS